MPKPITADMLDAMTSDQRKTLYQNASDRDTPAAHAILDLLSGYDHMGRPKTAQADTKAKTPARKAAPRAAAPKEAPARKPIKAIHGRQS